MPFFSFLWSPDPLAAVVIGITWAVFLWWANALLRTRKSLLGEQRLFLQLADIDELADGIREDGDSSLAARNATLRKFLNGREIPHQSVAARHVQAIYEAGWSDTRLDLSELSRLTLSRLFRSNQTLRSVLGLFIILGLFGTLAGLSKALAPLAALDLTGGVTAEMGDSLRALLDKLQSAFAPSVNGVLLTVVGVLTYSWYIRSTCAPLRDFVDDLTMSNWIPRLYPTSSQRILETLDEADRQAQDNLEAAQRVAAFADRLENDLGALQPSLVGTSESLLSLQASLAVADSAAKHLGSAAADLAPFREELRDAFGRSAEQSERTAGLVEALARQNSKLTEGVGVLRVFETSFVEHQARVNEKSEGLIEAATGAVREIESRNEEVIRAVGGPIVDRLGELDAGLRDGLENVRATLRKIEDPVGQSADRIERIARSFEEQMVQHIGELKREFHSQNQAAQQEGNALGALTEQVGRLIETVDRSSARQAELVDRLASAAGLKQSWWSRMTRTFRLRTSGAGRGARTGH